MTQIHCYRIREGFNLDRLHNVAERTLSLSDTTRRKMGTGVDVTKLWLRRISYPQPLPLDCSPDALKMQPLEYTSHVSRSQTIQIRLSARLQPHRKPDPTYAIAFGVFYF